MVRQRRSVDIILSFATGIFLRLQSYLRPTLPTLINVKKKFIAHWIVFTTRWTLHQKTGNQDVNRRTACMVSQMESQLSVPGYGIRYPTDSTQ
ncbi:MAG TPA: hypothetical protein DDX19_27540 [Rhodopirellula baltica]|nr:hypothetical protein [Rhodopirellula baltica]